jgi:hypothetical protein
MRILSFKIIFLLFSISILAQSPHGKDFNIDCSSCHQTDSWKVNLSKVSFDHSKTSFNLIGQHQNVDCKSCHSTLIFSQANNDCLSCHKDIHQGTVGFDCASCHTPTSWIVKDIYRIHQNSRFPLLGAHKLADCEQCHTSYAELKFDVLDVDCYSCHTQDYNNAQTPNHLTANFSKDCQECHNIGSLSWSTSNINHSFFPLVGGHALPSCYSCHQQNTFAGLTPECYSCHRQNYETTNDPSHISTGIPTTCDVCHSISGWKPAQFNHNITQFPFTGRHVNVNCADCHITVYTGTPTDCYSCHKQNFQSTTDPNHITSQFPTECSLCHTTSGWSGATFDHNTSGFPLTGKHISVSCADCHTTGYTGTTTDCYSCHQQNFQSTTDPNHIASQFPTDCALCHTTSGWDGATFNHSLSSFPLTGKHVAVSCADCHTTGYTGTPTDCYSCHQQNFQATTDPNHITSQFPTDCALCHTTSGWDGATFDHNTSSFPLTGSHIQVSCANCHANGYVGISTECVSCHQTNYQQAANPNHSALALPTNCESCHTTNPGWVPATFPIHSNYYPLVGAHSLINNCVDCHKGNFNSTPNTCYACHSTDYNSTTDPPHQSQNISQDCTTCHNMNNWSGATFNHSFYPISSKHNNVSCNECHSATGYNPQCLSCHQSNFLDGHKQGDRTDCWSCHSTSRWGN